MNNKTMNFYKNNAKHLIDRYNNTAISNLQALYIKHIPKNSNVLDIGFGSGRDLVFLEKNGFDIWGIDATDYFVEHIKKKISTKKSHFYQSLLPNIILGKEFTNFFTGILCIAVWMHLDKEDYLLTIKNISSILKEDGVIILSFSNGVRKTSDERHFENIDIEYLLKLFYSQGYSLVEKINSNDSLKRDELTWCTIVLKKSNTVQ